MPLSEGWRDQYQRMLRSRDRLTEAAGPSSIGSDEARDRLYHFFQDAFHLRDWLYNSDDPAVSAKAAVLKGNNNHIKATPTLALCADVCNGIKHLKLTTTQTGDQTTTVASQSAKITPATVAATTRIPGPGQSTPPAPKAAAAVGEHAWLITSNGQQHDAIGLADKVIAEWDKWLNDQQLVP